MTDSSHVVRPLQRTLTGVHQPGARRNEFPTLADYAAVHERAKGKLFWTVCKHL